MPKKRLIFTLLYDNGHFVLSRNFRLQRIGDLSWLNDNYHFQTVSRHIDELVILNVSRGDSWEWESFRETVQNLALSNFVPISVGGFGNDVGRATELLRSGVDKLVVNSALFTDQPFVEQLVQKFGRQCVVGSVDLQASETDGHHILINRGTTTLPGAARDHLEELPSHLVGELLVRSVKRDGTGQGLELELLTSLPKKLTNIPLIIGGGVGKPQHIIEGLAHENIAAVSTANLLNFIGTGLEEARDACLVQGIDLAKWI